MSWFVLKGNHGVAFRIAFTPDLIHIAGGNEQHRRCAELNSHNLTLSIQDKKFRISGTCQKP